MKRQLLLFVTMLMAVVMPMKLWAADGNPEPYAVLTGDTLLTFFYDDQKEVRGGMSVGPFISSYNVPWYDQQRSLTTAEFDPSFANCTSITSTAYWFYECYKLTSISGLQYLKTDNVTTMNSMFYDCSSLTSLDLTGFKTVNVTDMGYMFLYCSALKTIYAGSEWTTNAVTEGNSMFGGCTSLEGGAGTPYDVNHVDYTYAHIDGGTSNPGYFTDKNAPAPTLPYAVLSDNNTKLTFFYDDQKAKQGGMRVGPFISSYNVPWYDQCEYITTVEFDPSFANCTTLTSTAYWFSGCYNLTSISYIEYLKTDNVMDMGGMFAGCSALTNIDVSGFNTDNVTSMSSMFSGCSALTSLDVSRFNTDNVTNMNSMFSGCSSLTNLAVRHFNTTKVTSMSSMFFGCSSLTSLDVSGFNTANVTNMLDMFYGCSSLTSLDVNHFNTDNVTNMSSMFYGCSSLTSLDVSQFNTENVTSMSSMFSGCSGLTSLDVSHFNTANVTEMGSMFYGCSGLTNLDVNGFNTTNVTNMYALFYGCSGLTSLDVSHFNTGNVTYMYGMFSGCSSLTNLDVSHFNTGNVTYMNYMFYGCSGLTSLDVSGFSPGNVKGMSYMFDGCSSLTSLDLSHFDTSNVTDMSKIFNGCSSLTTIYVSSGWSTALVAQSDSMFFNCVKLVGGAETVYDPNHVDHTYAHIDEGTQNPGYFTGKIAFFPYAVLSDNNTKLIFYYDDQKTVRNGMGVGPFTLSNNKVNSGWDEQRDNITSVEFDESFANCTTIGSTSCWFYRFTNLTSIRGLNYLKTDNVTDMSRMFQDSPSFTSLDLSSFNTENVTNMSRMFKDCTSLVSISIDVSHFNTANVTLINGMFDGCSSLAAIDVSGFNTSKATDMGEMFAGCSSLKTLDLRNFNTANATRMHEMFAGCSGLTSINVSSFNTANVTEMGLMFDDCSSLTSLDLSSFNTSNVTRMQGMFDGDLLLTSIYVGDGWSTENVSEGHNVFRDCISLKGGAGTVYDANHTDYTYAHIDGGESNPGYFTDKNEAPTVEPYAVLSDNNTKLAFFYDDQKDLRGGMGVGPFLPDSERWGGHQGEIVTVVFDTSFANCTTLTSTASWFAGCGKLTSISDISNLKTDNVTDMCYMFSGCSSLTSLNVSGFKTDNVTDMNSMFNGCSSLTMLDVGGLNTANVTDMYGMFGGCSTLTSLDLSNFKTDNVTSMNRMFDGCSSLTSLDVSNFNTANVTYMGYMFWGCSSLTSLDVRNFKTDKVTEMIHMFSGCSNLTMLDIASFNTENVASMFYMFNGCSNLKSIYAGDGWSTAKVENGNGMFNNCTSLVGGSGSVYDANHTDHTYAHIDGGASNPGYFTANNERVINGNFVTTDYSSFAYALEDNGTVIEITDNDIVDDTEEPGNRCIKIVSKDNATENWDSHFIIRIGEPLKEGQTYKFSMRAKASRNVSISSQARTTPDQYLHYRMLGNFDLTTGWQTYNVEGVVESEQAGCTVIALLLNVDKSSAEYFFDDISFRVNEAPSASPEPYAVLSQENTVLTFYYDDQKDVRGGLSVGPFDLNNYPSWYNQRESITTAEFDDSFANCTTLTSTASWFQGFSNLTTITGLEFLNTVNVTSMEGMFAYCSSLTSLDVSGFNTENVTSMEGMFYHCSSLTSLDVSGFNTSKVTSMNGMFYDCSSLTSLDIRHFDTSGAISMYNMFGHCTSLNTLDLSHFDTSGVVDMHNMFRYCSALTDLNVSSFNTSNVTNMNSMFGKCNSLITLDLSSFNTAKVKDMQNMFRQSQQLKTIYAGDGWSTASVEQGDSIFYHCTSLIGGAGTPYDSTHVDVSYAHIDGGTSNPGYFTAKNAPEGEATFDGKVARVSGERTLDEAFEQRGGRAEATRTIAAIIWNKESALTESDLQGITNPNLLVYVNEARLAPSNVQNVVINGLAREIVLTDAQDGNNDWYAPQAFVAERISYTRNFAQSTSKGTSRGWESIALPFDVQTIQHESKGVIAPFNNSASNKHFWLRRLTDNGLQAATNIEANTPYIISMPNSEEYTSDYNLNGRVTFSAQNIDVPATTTKVLALADSSIVMVPAMQRQSRSSSVWALNVGEVRGQYFEGSVFERDYRTVRPFEAYTIHRQENGQPAPRYVPIQEIAGTTGIETINPEPQTVNQWYDMQGRKLEGKPARKGVYISNGKKVVVK